MERNMLVREIFNLSVENEVRELSFSSSNTRHLFNQESPLAYGKINELSFLRNDDQKTIKKSKGYHIFYKKGEPVTIVKERNNWMLVSGLANYKKNKVELPALTDGFWYKIDGWVKKGWVNVDDKSAIIEVSGSELNYNEPALSILIDSMNPYYYSKTSKKEVAKILDITTPLEEFAKIKLNYLLEGNIKSEGINKIISDSADYFNEIRKLTSFMKDVKDDKLSNIANQIKQTSDLVKPIFNFYEFDKKYQELNSLLNKIHKNSKIKNLEVKDVKSFNKLMEFFVIATLETSKFTLTIFTLSTFGSEINKYALELITKIDGVIKTVGKAFKVFTAVIECINIVKSLAAIFKGGNIKNNIFSIIKSVATIGSLFISASTTALILGVGGLFYATYEGMKQAAQIP